MTEREREHEELCDRYFSIVAEWIEEDPEDPEVAAKLVKMAEEENLDCAPDPDDEDSIHEVRAALMDRMATYALSVDVRVVKTVVLATGGPEYGFEAECSDDGTEVYNVRFYYQGWYSPRIYRELSEAAQREIVELFGLEYN